MTTPKAGKIFEVAVLADGDGVFIRVYRYHPGKPWKMRSYRSKIKNADSARRVIRRGAKMQNLLVNEQMK